MIIERMLWKQRLSKHADLTLAIGGAIDRTGYVGTQHSFWNEVLGG
jgi:hypothetical protein